MTERQTVAGAYAKIESHEELCALRQQGIIASISELKSWVKTGVASIAGVAIALIGFLGHEVYSNLQQHEVAQQERAR